MDAKEFRARQMEIARKVPQPFFKKVEKKSNIRRCSRCRRVLTGYDVKRYREEAGKADPYGFPEVCEDCAEKEVRP
jgi:hypothetical protein